MNFIFHFDTFKLRFWSAHMIRYHSPGRSKKQKEPFRFQDVARPPYHNEPNNIWTVKSAFP